MSQATRILLALIVGLSFGIGCTAFAADWVPAAIDIAEPIGTAWLNGLQMTIVPLVLSLVVLGVAATADVARAGRLATRSLILFMGLLWSGAILAAFVTPVLLDLWPLDPAAAEALKAALATAKPIGDVPPFGEFMSQMVPSNPVSAAANNAFLPLMIFALSFAFAITRLAKAQRDLLVDLFRAIADAMLVVIGWVLLIAPVGVFALAFLVGAKAGTAAFGALLHYVLIVSSIGVILWISSFFMGAIGGRLSIMRFARATMPAQVVAISTQSSLASLPAMLKGAGQIGVPTANSGIILPLAVAIFRFTGPAMNLAVAIYIARWYGVPLTPQSLTAGVIVASITTLGALSLPGAITYISSIAPIAVAMGVPVAPLGLLVAIENFPDIVRTLGNVTMDLATTATLSARSAPAPESTEDALIEATGP